jgi:hypothetical protein
MKVFEANITHQVSGFLNEKLKNINSFTIANRELFDFSGIRNFFDNNEDLESFKETTSEYQNLVEEPDRTEYGDFQTNFALANKITLDLALRNILPEIIIEPTCGAGNFIIASLKNFNSSKYIFGIEIYKPYVWETKFKILRFFLDNPNNNKPEIIINHCNVFDFKFDEIAWQFSGKDFLIIGNPPWVTNSKLGSLNSSNLPIKANFKNHSGLDAITGKSNFDIAEYISLMMIETFQGIHGHMVLLLKNTVIKNIVFEQNKKRYKIASIEKQCIDSKKEFDVSVEASLLFCKLDSIPEFTCKEFNFYKNKKHHKEFGWIEDKFVSNIDSYIHTEGIDGNSPFIWRQGLKHDCSDIMELSRINCFYINGINEKVEIEETLVYGILKSSDLKNTVINQTRKFTIVTQKKVGQETKYIESEFPRTYQYLTQHSVYFNARKSSIYNNKPSFSIFGIGDYSFKPFKVAISGLYKTFHFTIIMPLEDKPVMLDDTCYFIGFDILEYAVYSLILLNSETTKQFLQSITFSDAKRTFTKDVLMRIDFLKLATTINKRDLNDELEKINVKYNLNLSLKFWDKFLVEMKPQKTEQIKMFA